MNQSNGLPSRRGALPRAEAREALEKSNVCAPNMGTLLGCAYALCVARRKNSLIWLLNPSSTSLSPSSSITYFMFLKPIHPHSTKSLSRPGVATRTWHPAASFAFRCEVAGSIFVLRIVCAGFSLSTTDHIKSFEDRWHSSFRNRSHDSVVKRNNISKQQFALYNVGKRFNWLDGIRWDACNLLVLIALKIFASAIMQFGLLN